MKISSPFVERRQLGTSVHALGERSYESLVSDVATVAKTVEEVP